MLLNSLDKLNVDTFGQKDSRHCVSKVPLLLGIRSCTEVPSSKVAGAIAFLRKCVGWWGTSRQLRTLLYFVGFISIPSVLHWSQVDMIYTSMGEGGISVVMHWEEMNLRLILFLVRGKIFRKTFRQVFPRTWHSVVLWLSYPSKPCSVT